MVSIGTHKFQEIKKKEIIIILPSWSKKTLAKTVALHLYNRKTIQLQKIL